jgi:hypothetical protein
VRFAVWSEENGQDDLMWYNANSAGEALALYTNHRGYGKYYIHTYIYENGKMQILSNDTITIGQTDMATTVTKLSDTSYEVLISGVPIYMNSVVLPIWSDRNGQDDIKWYTATKVSDTSYRAVVNLADHQYDAGNYNVHIYGTTSLLDNKLTGLATTSGFTADTFVRATNHNPSNGTLDVVVSENSANPIRAVRTAAWSEEYQANLYWYTNSTVVDGKVTVTVDAKNHGNKSGDYTVHTYVETADGKQTGYNVGLYQMTLDGNWVYSTAAGKWYYCDSSGNFIKEAANIAANTANTHSNPFLAAIQEGSIDGLSKGVLPSITAAQAILESGWGKSSLSLSPNHNLFGIKASSDWTGDTVLIATQEYIDGKFITVEASFRKYNSWTDSLVDHASFFTNSAWRINNYKAFIGELDYKQAAKNLQAAGYATDPEYANKLINIIESYKLYEWDAIQ